MANPSRGNQSTIKDQIYHPQDILNKAQTSQNQNLSSIKNPQIQPYEQQWRIWWRRWRWWREIERGMEEFTYLNIKEWNGDDWRPRISPKIAKNRRNEQKKRNDEKMGWTHFIVLQIGFGQDAGSTRTVRQNPRNLFVRPPIASPFEPLETLLKYLSNGIRIW